MAATIGVSVAEMLQTVSRQEMYGWSQHFLLEQERVTKEQWLNAALVQSLDGIRNVLLTPPGQRVPQVAEVSKYILKLQREDADAPQSGRQTFDDLPIKDRIQIMQSVFCGIAGIPLSEDLQHADGT